MTEELSVTASGSDAYERIKRMLAHSGIEAEDIIEMEVTVIHTDGESEGEGFREQTQEAHVAARLWRLLDDHGGWLEKDEVVELSDFDVDEVETGLDRICREDLCIRRELPSGEYEYLALQEGEDTDVEYGPDGKSFTREGETGGTPGKKYKGVLPTGPFVDVDGTAIRPDANVGRVLEKLVKGSEWTKARDLMKEDDLDDLSEEQLYHSLSDLFNRYELVKRRRWPKDKRVKEYAVKPEGKQAYERGVEIANAINENWREEAGLDD